MVSAELLIAKAEEIAAEEPRYQLGQDGSHGQCDCIGLVIGAIRRAGGQWRGMHGCNYAARKEMSYLQPIAGSAELTKGEIVFKAYMPGQGGYNLPERYMPGKDYYNGDLKDYYHVGIVESVYPLRIRHMTSPRAKMDTSIGKWAYHGKLRGIEISAGGAGGKKMGKAIVSGGNIEAPINMRRAASTGSAIVAEIPQGSEVEILEGGGVWNRIQFGKLEGYVMSQFIHTEKAAEKESIYVSRAWLENIYDEIGDKLGLRG